ncbi:hypothetical protein RvVAT039_22480 [Agrobacterium vitis]|nr:hypothetical protein RvVAT039_22480 [Agrobacterium vitis]
MAQNTYSSTLRNCPPDDASSANGIIYKVVKKHPMASNEFDSDVERKVKNTDDKNCQCWGCSVWVDQNGIDTALTLFPFWKKRYIVASAVNGGDGVIKHTPSNLQPRHHTFWKAVGVDVVSRSTVHRFPDQV